MDPLAHQLIIATLLVSATVIIHLVGLDLLQATLGWHLKRLTLWVHLDRTVVPVGIVLGLFALHGLEIWLYALVYWHEGLLQRLGFQRTAAMHAVFFSGIAALVSAMGIHSVCV